MHIIDDMTDLMGSILGDRNLPSDVQPRCCKGEGLTSKTMRSSSLANRGSRVSILTDTTLLAMECLLDE